MQHRSTGARGRQRGGDGQDDSAAIPRGARDAIAQAAAELAGLPPFSELTPVERAKLAAALEEVDYDQGDVIFAEGELADALYILRDGLAERLADGVRLDLVQPPAVFGDLALLRDERRATTLVAVSPCVIWRLPADRFTRLVNRTPGIAARFAANVSDRLVAAQRDVAGLAREVEGLTERLYDSLEPAEQSLLERLALLPALDPRVAPSLVGRAGDARWLTRLPLADVLVQRADGADEADAAPSFPPAFRRFLQKHLAERLGPAGSAEARREVAAVARSLGAADVAIVVLAEGGLLDEAAALADRAGRELTRAGRTQEAEALQARVSEHVAAAQRPPALAGEPEPTAFSGVTERVVATRLRWPPGRVALGLTLGALLLVVGWMVPPPGGLSAAGWHALVTLIAIVPVLGLDALPEGIVALALAAVWVVGGVAPPRVAMGGFATAGWVLVVGVLLIGAAIASSGLLYRLALQSVRLAKGGFAAQAAALAAVGILIGPANPNATGRVMLVAPAISDLIEALGYAPRSRGAAGLAMASLVGFGQMVAPFLTSSTTAVLVYTMLPEASRANVSWGSWALRAAPTTLLLYALLVPAIVLIYRPRGEPLASNQHAERTAKAVALQQALLGPLSRAEIVSLVVTTGVLVGFMTQPIHGVDPAWLGVLATVVLVAAGVLSMDGIRSVNWSFALFYGILPGMGDVLSTNKVDTWLAAMINAVIGGLAATPVLFVAALTLIAFAISFVLRWQAAAPLLTIALTPVAVAAGMDPWIVAFVAVVAANGFFLPYQSTTYLALYHGTGGRLFSHAQARPAALAFGVGTLLALCASVPVWHGMGLL